MSDTPSAYARALLVELQAHPSRGLAIHAELQREGWYVDDNGELAKVKQQPRKQQPRKERADADPAPENTAQPTPARRTRKPSDAEDSGE